jgi:hypothetical protein
MGTIQSNITIVPKYLDCRTRFTLAGGVSSLEDDSIIHEAQSKSTLVTEISDRVRRGWQLNFGDKVRENITDTEFLYNLFELCRNSKGFPFISPLTVENTATDMPLWNPVAETYAGDGTTTVFQARRRVTLAHDIGGGSTSSDAYDILYLLDAANTGNAVDVLTAKANGSNAPVSGYSSTTGLVTLNSAPANGHVMTWSGRYATPAHIVSPDLSRSMVKGAYTEVRSIQIKEIF